MNSAKYLVLTVLSALALSGCNESPGCVVQGGIDLFLAPAIAVGLECTNEPAVLASLQAVGQSTGICKPAPSPSAAASPGQFSAMIGGSLLGDLCTNLGNAIVAQAAGAIPKEWGCSATAAQNGLKGVVAVACGMIPAAQAAGQAVAAK